MDWRNEDMDPESDANSMISQDRMSDDTDFLIGHNISLHNNNDSFLDARSSTTTDLIYQQELNDQDVPSNHKINGYSPIKYSPGSNSLLRSTVQSRYQVAISNNDETSNGSKEINKSMTKINNDHELSTNNIINSGLSSHNSSIGDKNLKRIDAGVKVSSYRREERSENGNSPRKPASNQKFDNIWEQNILRRSSNDDSVVEENLESIIENKKSPGSQSSRMFDYDSKVKEGEALLAKLLGKENLSEALKSKNEMKQLVSHKSERIEQGWKKPLGDNHPNNELIVSPANHDKTRSNHAARKDISNKADSSYYQLQKLHVSDVEMEAQEYHFDVANRRSISAVSDFSKSSSDSGHPRGSRSSQEQLYARPSNHNFGKMGSSTASSSKSVQLVKTSSHKTENMSRNSSKLSKEDVSSPPQKSFSPLGRSGSFEDQAHGTESTSIEKIRVHDIKRIDSSNSFTKEWQSQKAVSSGEMSHKVPEKVQTAEPNRFSEKSPLNANLMKTSTPQKSSWPVSPIKQRTGDSFQDQEELIAANERRLKAIKFEIEKESMRKDAIMHELSSAEESLQQMKMNIQSLEQLVEEHKKQAVATRSELMELELQRNESQRKLTEVTDELKRQKKELESIPEELKESNISTKIAILQNERDELNRECKILREKCKDTEYLSNSNMELMKKIRNMQEQLYNEQDENRDKLRSLKEELEKEKRKVVEANIEQLNSVRKIREEVMDAKKAEIDAIATRVEKEKVDEIEMLRERFQREIRTLQQRIEELEDDNRRITRSTNERLGKVQEQTEQNLLREIEKVTKKINKEKAEEIAFFRQKHRRELEELELQIKSKQTEIDTLQAMLRQQEDSTRLLGEKLRNEAKDQICMAVEKERSSRLEELRNTELELEKLKEERDNLTVGNNTELDKKEKENERLRNLVNKIKRELEDSRQENYEAREEKLHAISKTRLEMKDDVERLKTKIREHERIEQTIFLDINEECMKTGAVTGKSYPSVKRSYISSDPNEANPIMEALNTLRSSNNDLRKQLMMYKKKAEEIQLSDDYQQSKSDHDSSSEKTHTPESLKLILSGSSEESKSARILKHLQSRVKQLRQGNESMKRSFGSDEGDTDLDSTAGSSFYEQAEDSSFSSKLAKTQSLENSLKNAEDQAQKYANLLSQKMTENTKLQKMLTQASKENIKLERLHSVLQQKVASGASV